MAMWNAFNSGGHGTRYIRKISVRQYTPGGIYFFIKGYLVPDENRFCELLLDDNKNSIAIRLLTDQTAHSYKITKTGGNRRNKICVSSFINLMSLHELIGTDIPFNVNNNLLILEDCLMSENKINRENDEEIISIVRSVLDNGTGKAETANEHVLIKLMQIRGTPITSFEFDQDRVDMLYEQWVAEHNA